MFFQSYNSLKEKTDRNGLLAAVYSLIIWFIMYISIIVISLYTYGNEIEPNILTNVGRSSDVFSIILRILFLIISAMHIPMAYFIGKEWILIIIDELMRRSYSSVHDVFESINYYEETPKFDLSEGAHDAYLTLHPLIYYGVSIGVYFGIVICSVFVDNLVFLLGK